MELKPESNATQEKPKKEILVLIDGQEVLLEQKALLEKLGAEAPIRIPEAEFEQIEFKDGLFAHFNLEKTNHMVGSRYVLMSIARAGARPSESQEEIPPLLSLNEAVIVECIDVQNSLPYDQLTPEHFSHSMDSLGDQYALSARIQERYGSSRKDLSAEGIRAAGVGYTLLRFIKKVDEVPQRVISPENGFAVLSTESVSSKVFIKEGKVYKLNNRNSLARQKKDLQVLEEKLKEFLTHLPKTEVFECEYQGELYTCVTQPRLEGTEIKNVQREILIEALKKNKEFLLTLLSYFFEAIEAKQLYPDLVGHPQDPEWFNSVNLMLEETTGNIILCDVGLSPHEDTVTRSGEAFYDSDNVKTYVAKMGKFQEFLLTL